MYWNSGENPRHLFVSIMLRKIEFEDYKKYCANTKLNKNDSFAKVNPFFHSLIDNF